MMQVLQIVSLLLVAIAMSFALAHAAELPGKMRLDQTAYAAIQTIYHPGFTIGGASEPLAIITLAALLAVTPIDSPAFVWTAASLVAVIAMQAVYWLVTHPVNRVWLKGETLPRASAAFFAVGSGKDEGTPQGAGDWKHLRNRWECSHVARASLGALALTLLAIAVTTGG